MTALVPPLSPTMSESAKAVFLSYASQDVVAALRLCTALRAAGVEVWFDQDALVGGDAWDQKIRGQVASCALFVPVVSAATQARREGYFRLEWRLADERTHLMAEGTPFLLPVVIDDTKDREALVPKSFLGVQWTRLPGALPTPQFFDQVKRLLGASVTSDLTAPPMPMRPAPVAPATAPVVPPAAKSRFPTAIVAALGIAVLALVGYIALRPTTKGVAAPAAAAKQVAEAKPAAPAATKVSDKSIAVLPLANMSEDKDTGFFADGVHEDLLTNLALISELKVVSRTTMTQYRGTSKSMKQIGEELGVAYILEGSVRRSGNKVRVTGQLINARTDEHVWAKSYDRDLTDIFAIQASLSQEIASALQAAITPQAQKFIERRPTENPVAYDAFLKGRDIRNKSRTGKIGPLKQAEEQFQFAVNQDPKFAAAWGELATAHALHVFWHFDETPARLAQGDAAIATAQRLAPDSPEVMRQVGTYAYYAHRDYATATAQYEKVARLQPNDATVFNSLALILRRQGRWAESLAKSRKALDLDPGNISYHRTCLSTLRDGRRWDEAMAEQRRLIALLPDDLAEQANLPRLAFAATGSWQAFDELLARLTPAQRESPRVIELRKFIAAFVKSDPAEFKRLDTLQPYFDGDGGEHYLQACDAAAVYAAAGDPAAMRARIADFPAELRTRLEREPSNTKVMDFLASFEAMLGHTDEAVRLTSRKLELLPEMRDALDGPVALYYTASVHAMVGDKDRALAELARVLRMPGAYGSPHTMRTDPYLFALRGDPRFEVLLNEPKNNAPLF